MNIFWGILVSVVAFAVMIFIHEFGHFITAKMFGVKVNRFALGMGPAIFKFGKGETEYSLRLFPIGGYCAMEGEDETSDDPRAFVNQRPCKRIIVLAAGAVMNILLGLIIISILVSTMPLLGTRMVAVKPEEAASTVFQDHDEILKVNNRRVYIATDIDYILALDPDGKADFKIKRDGKKLELKDVQLEKIPDKDSDATGTLRNFTIYGQKKNFWRVIRYSFDSTMSTVRLVLYSFASLITGKIPMRQVSGPVGVTTAFVKNISSGWKNTMKLIGMISINLGVFNLFPIPALDGSRILFALIEMIFRRPVNRKAEGWIHSIGFILIIILSVIIFAKDILSLFIRR